MLALLATIESADTTHIDRVGSLVPADKPEFVAIVPDNGIIPGACKNRVAANIDQNGVIAFIAEDQV